jgi:NAD(P)-dependent dehydrogenase (short-subunit alcohol dehydrogenase family)
MDKAWLISGSRFLEDRNWPSRTSDAPAYPGPVEKQNKRNRGIMTERLKELAGKVAIITGSARNLGRTYAEALARNGADIVVHGHGAAATGDAEETSRLVKAQGTRAIIVQGDIADPALVRHLFDEAMNAFGRVDIVINNAGMIIKKPLAEVTEEDFDRSFGVNAKGAFFTMQEAARRISDNGRIINMGTSLLGVTTGLYSVYAGSKAPLEDFTRALAKEIGARGVTVNTVCPGPVDTPFFHGQESAQSEAFSKQTSVANRLGRPEDIIPLIEFLASPRSQWITAQTLFINGGMTAR